MVSPQIIIVGIAIIGFFATGGIGKVSGAISTAKNDFTFAKDKITNFQLGLNGKETAEVSEVVKEVESIKDKPIKDINEIPKCLSCIGLGDAQMPINPPIKDTFIDRTGGSTIDRSDDFRFRTGGKQTPPPLLRGNEILNDKIIRGFK